MNISRSIETCVRNALKVAYGKFHDDKYGNTMPAPDLDKRVNPLVHDLDDEGQPQLPGILFGLDNEAIDETFGGTHTRRYLFAIDSRAEDYADMVRLDYAVKAEVGKSERFVGFGVGRDRRLHKSKAFSRVRTVYFQ